MARVSEAEFLALQKRLLVAQSELYREHLAADCQRLERATGWVPPALSLARVAGPAALVAAPFALWWLRKKRPSLRHFAVQLVAGFRAARRLQSLWDLLLGPGSRGRGRHHKEGA